VKVRDPQAKETYLEIARTWRELAEKAEQRMALVAKRRQGQPNFLRRVRENENRLSRCQGGGTVEPLRGKRKPMRGMSGLWDEGKYAVRIIGVEAIEQK